MIPRVPQLHALYFLLCLCMSSGAVEKLQMSDTIPIVNPTTPSTTTPLVAFVSPPPPLVAFVSPPPPQRDTIPTTPSTTTPLVGFVSPPPPTTLMPTSGAWCVAIPSSSPTALQVALDYACGYGGTDCSAIQPGGSCNDPNTVQDHASYAFNDYYQKNPIPTSCSFGGMAQLTYADPSRGNCHFASPTSTATTPPISVTPSPVVVSPPPPVYYTPTTTTPGSPTIYGIAEPTGSPSSATSIRSSLLIVLITTCLIGPMVIANCF